MEETDINDLLTSQYEKLSNEELLQPKLQFVNEEYDGDHSIKEQ